MTDQAPQGVPFVPDMHVIPAPMTYVMEAKQLQTPSGIERVVVLHMEHATGRTTLVLPAEFAKGLGAKLIEQATGLEVATHPLQVVARG